MKKSVRIILNADDLGNLKSTDSILHMIKNGFVSSASIISNAPKFRYALSSLPKDKRSCIGVHLNLTDHSPLTKNKDLKPLLNAEGHFCQNIKTKTIYLNKDTQSAIFQEWSAQIERVLKYNRQISHIDSHEHVHTFPSLFVVLKKLQIKYGIRRIRTCRNIYPISTQEMRVLSKTKKLFWHYALKMFPPVKITDGFTDFLTFYDRAKIDSTLIRYNTVELMTHPGNKNYKKENDLLKTNWRDDMPFETTLINFNQL